MTVTAAPVMAGAGAGAGQPGSGWGLVEAAAGGDREAFGRIYEQYVGEVFRFVVVRVGDRSLAEDLTSETFLRALRSISTVRYQGRGIGAWLITIARNLIRDHVKSSRYRLDSVTAEVPEPGVVGEGPEGVVIARSVTAQLLRAVAGLDRGQRDCVVLRFWVGLSVTDTATVMGRTPYAVRMLQHRAVRRLARLLRGLAPGVS